MANIRSNMIPGVGGGNGGGGGVAGVTSADHFTIDNNSGNFAYDDGISFLNMASPDNTGKGSVYGTGEGSIHFILGEDARLHAMYASGERGTIDVGDPTVNSPAPLTEYIDLNVSVIGTKLLFAIGSWTVEAGIDMRLIIKRVSDDVILATTCSDTEWNGGEIGAGYGGIVQTNANAFTLAPLTHAWTVADGTIVHIIRQFKSPVTLVGTGTWGVDWVPGWQNDGIPLTSAQVVYYDEWAIKTYGINDKIVEAGVIYRANEAGAQTGTFAANSTKWTEVGNIPSVMVYKSGISVADFNALTVGSPGWFYRISDTGNLIGGQAAVVGDQVVINTELTGTIGAAEFDYFPNQEPGTIVPPWTAKTYSLDDAIFEGGILYYCESAGAQVTDFASNSNKWFHHPRLDNDLRLKSDATHNLGTSGKSFKRLYISQGIYYDGEKRIALNVAYSMIQSPDMNSGWKAEDDALRALINGFSRINIDTTKAEMLSPDGTTSFTVTDTSVTTKVAGQTRVVSGAGSTDIYSPDGSTRLRTNNDGVENNGYTKLGTDAPNIKTKLITGTTAAGSGQDVSVAHGLDVAKIISMTCLVQNAGGNWIPPNFQQWANNQYDAMFNNANVRVYNRSGQSNIYNRPFKAFLVYIA